MAPKIEKDRPDVAQNELLESGRVLDTPVWQIDDFEDYVAFHIKCDQTYHGDSVVDKNMSRKKCRFCD